MPAIELREVRKVYPGNAVAIDQVSLRVQPGSVTALLGPSGCGKTTTLRLIAGLEAPDAGVVALHGRPVAGRNVWVPPEQRGVGLVFQEGALFPHMTAADNIAFALHRQLASERHRRVQELLELVGLPRAGADYPHQLSGGQQQRVALARALAARPALVLLDEPFANLDGALRRQLRAEVHRLLREAGVTVVLVTHDYEEALSVADTLAVMAQGRIVQTGTPRELYTQPANRTVATLIGEANLLAAQAQGAYASCALGYLPLAAPTEGPVELLIRPEALRIEPDSNGDGVVEHVAFTGRDQLVQVRLAEQMLHARVDCRLAIAAGTRVRLTVAGPLLAYPITIRTSHHGVAHQNANGRAASLAYAMTGERT